MRADLGIGPPGIGLLKSLQRTTQITLAELNPAQTVLDKKIFRGETHGMFDQFTRLGQA